jgi:hypothetical protein
MTISIIFVLIYIFFVGGIIYVNNKPLIQSVLQKTFIINKSTFTEEPKTTMKSIQKTFITNKPIEKPKTVIKSIQKTFNTNKPTEEPKTVIKSLQKTLSTNKPTEEPKTIIKSIQNLLFVPTSVTKKTSLTNEPTIVSGRESIEEAIEENLKTLKKMNNMSIDNSVKTNLYNICDF